MSYLSADDLLAGGAVQHDVEIPVSLLGSVNGGPRRVRLRPLTVRDVQRVTRAAKDSDALLSALMLKEGLVEPALSFEQVQGLATGVARFLIEHLNRISGLKAEKSDVADVVQAPMAKACFVLAREFGWTPQQVGDLTLGQVLLYLEMIRQNRQDAAQG